MTTVTCGTHGEQPETFVCTHIVESLKDGERRGFWYSRGEDGVYDAVCAMCEAMSQDEFDALGGKNTALLCFGCFKDAAGLNGIEIE